MASFVRKAMVYLGLADDEYDEYEHYDHYEEAPEERAPARPYPDPQESGGGGGGIRTLHRTEAATRTEVAAPPVVAAEPPPAPVPAAPRPAVVRPLSTAQAAKVHVVAPLQFSDAQEIGDRLKSSQPVIVNLQNGDRELSRRMIDFCSGATYALGGSMDKVADQVFLLTPSNVEVSAEEKRRLQERGLYRA